MPTTPELGYVAREVGVVEVAHQSDAKQLGGAYRDVGIAGEVAVNLEGERDGGDEQLHAVIVGVVVPHPVDGYRAVVGQNHLFAESPKDLAHAVDGGSVVEGAGLEELGQEVGGALDGAGYQLRKETDEGEEGYHVVGGFNLALVHVDGVAERLEGVERDADGEHQMEGDKTGVPAEGGAGFLKALGEEVVILVDAEDEEVEDDVSGGNPFG